MISFWIKVNFLVVQRQRLQRNDSPAKAGLYALTCCGVAKFFSSLLINILQPSAASTGLGYDATLTLANALVDNFR
jgi:hypothetical protein